ncbi:MAG: D-sedoheptulose 7-phosphate isomerase [Candidatus Omnitrophica bacterium]|nr:D-sedoheptulose 7-phosphate isomerase [Candidatus Omnitrophota bacterium]
MRNKIQAIIQESIQVKKDTLEKNIDVVERAAGVIISSFRNGGKVLLCGNGGSAADSQHIAAEFIGRFQRERKALPAIALTTDTSILTSLANDYSYDIVFSRQVEALGKKGDILIGISTSGKSANVIKAFEAAKKLGLMTVAFVGHDGGPMGKIADMAVIVPSKVTARIQESHIALFHALCEVVEDEFAK